MELKDIEGIKRVRGLYKCGVCGELTSCYDEIISEYICSVECCKQLHIELDNFLETQG